MNYRQRIYKDYVNARSSPLAPQSLAGLGPRMHYLRHLVRKYFPRDRSVRILEIGCGHGALLHALSEQGYRNACGVDTSVAQVEAAKRLGIVGVELGDLISALLIRDAGSLDVIVAFDVIEHFRKEELLELVDEVHRVLSPGGKWIIHVPNGESPFGARMREWDFTHELAFTRTSLTQLLRASDFEGVACFEDRPVVHGIKSGVRAILWQCIRTMLLAYIAVETGVIDRAAVFSQNMLAVATRSRTK